jgi:hypothetical protein
VGERADIVIIPTELERADAAWDIAIGLAVVLGVVYLVKPHEMGGLGLPWLFIVPPLIPFALWILTGEYAGDLPWVGGLASGLRSKFGARRAHEWILAFAWYARVTLWPNGKDHCEAFSNSSRRRITRWRVRLSKATQCKRSRIGSWASAIRSRSSR